MEFPESEANLGFKDPLECQEQKEAEAGEEGRVLKGREGSLA